MLKRIFFAALVIFFQLYATGQTSALKQADKYYKDSSYYNAIINYEIYLGLRIAPLSYAPYTNNKKKKLLEFEQLNESKPNAEAVFYNLGQCYRMLNDYVSAEKWYAKVLDLSSPKFPLTRLWRGICLRAMGQHKSADKELRRFIKDNAKGDQSYTPIANNELNTISFIRQQTETKKPPSYALHKLKGDVSQIEGAYAPIVLNDTTLVFTSARIIDTTGKFSKVNSHINHLFFNTISIKDSVIGKSALLKFPSIAPTNEGTPTTTPTGNALYFTRWEGTGGKINSSIYTSKKKNDSIWDYPVKLEEKINKLGYNSNQPFITDDGKYLLYASDRPDGVGKYDIWAATIDTSGAIGEPFNLTSINTKDDDKAPFYHSNTKTLVFSSDGRIGMGGFDLYMATGELNSLSTPVNMGSPVNSVKDDNYFFSASKDSLMKRAFVSSDRASECCLEVFSVERLPKKIFKQKIDGLLSDCKTGSPLPYGTVTINNQLDTTKNITMVTGTNGLFLVNLTDSTAGLSFKRKGYNDRAQSFRYNPDLYVDTTCLIEVCLTKAKKIYYKQHLEASVIDCDTKKPLPKAFVTVVNALDTSKNVVLATSAKGTFSTDLNDSINGLWFEKKGYFDKEIRFALQSDSLETDTTYRLTYCMEVFKPDEITVAPVQITDPNKVDKVVAEINKSDTVTVHFEFNKTDLTQEAIEQLDKLLAILKTYPTISVQLNITGHTDAKGTDEVNRRIGHQRAINCLGYVIQRGISESRLKLTSVGKSQPVAPDSINGKDNPAGRAKNRRVEMKANAKVINQEVTTPTQK